MTKAPAAVVRRAQRLHASSSFGNLTFLVRRAPGKAVAASCRSLVSAERQLLIKGWWHAAALSSAIVEIFDDLFLSKFVAAIVVNYV